MAKARYPVGAIVINREVINVFRSQSSGNYVMLPNLVPDVDFVILGYVIAAILPNTKFEVISSGVWHGKMEYALKALEGPIKDVYLVREALLVPATDLGVALYGC